MYPERSLATIAMVSVLALAAAQPGMVKAQSRSGQPSKTVNRGRAKIFYYDEPPAVAVATTFYVIGSYRNSLWRDFLAITAVSLPGQKINKPRCVQLHFTSSTRTRSKYGVNPRLTILADGKPILSADLHSGPTESRRGKYLELYELPQMSFEQFTELAQAKEVRVKFGSIELKLKREHLEALNDMLKSVES